MVTEDQVKVLAYYIWEQEGRPEGKDREHYFRARKILEEAETPSVIPLPAWPPAPELPPGRPPATRRTTRKPREGQK